MKQNDIIGFLIVVFEIIVLTLPMFLVFGFVMFGVAQITERKLTSALPGTDFWSLSLPGREIRPVPPTSPPARVFAGLARAEERTPAKAGSSAIAEARRREIAERPRRVPLAIPEEERERRIEPSGVSRVPERTGRNNDRNLS